MGIAPSNSNPNSTSTSFSSSISKTKRFNSASYSDLDKVIFLELQLLNGTITNTNIQIDFPSIPFQTIIKDKDHKVKNRRFNKWYKMAYQFNANCFSSLSIDSIKQSMNNDNDINSNSSPNDPQSKDTEISYCEQGLRAYYLTNPIHFEQRLLKGPPDAFRWLSWLICAGIPINRPSEKYIKLLSFDLDKEAEEQILKDVTRTLGDSVFNTQNIQNKLYRLLKSIALLDKEMSYVQGINFLCAFFLFVPYANEIDIFYFLIGLFSMTFSSKFGMRDFYTEQFPLIRVCTTIFEEQLNKKFPKLSNHINNIQLPSLCWVNPWMQTIFVNVFPSEASLRIWDAFLVQGIPFLISFALSVTELIQKDVLGIKDIVQVVEYLKLLNPNGKNNFKGKHKEIQYDIEKLIDRAVNAYPIALNDIEELLSKDFPEVNREVVYNYKHINEYLDDKLNKLHIKSKGSDNDMNIVQGDVITFFPQQQDKLQITNGANGKEEPLIVVKPFDDDNEEDVNNDEEFNDEDMQVNDECNSDETNLHMKDLSMKNTKRIRIKRYEF